jgi:inner membrane protein
MPAFPPLPSARIEHGVIPALALILAADALLANRDFSRPVEALLDEPAHLATAFLLLSALPAPRSLPFVAGLVLGAVGVDGDHVPGELGLDIITRGTGRPVTHSLPTSAVLLLLSRALSGGGRVGMVGVACGVLAHFVRDIGTGGLPLLWPISKRRVRAPYGVYAAALLVSGGAAWWSARR